MDASSPLTSSADDESSSEDEEEPAPTPARSALHRKARRCITEDSDSDVCLVEEAAETSKTSQTPPVDDKMFNDPDDRCTQVSFDKALKRRHQPPRSRRDSSSSSSASEGEETQEEEGPNVDPMEEEGGEREQLTLPDHQRCAVHSLNLVATTDCEKFFKNLPNVRGSTNAKVLIRSALGVLRGFWNRYTRSTSVSRLHSV